MKILTRYVIREHLGPLAFALSALTALILLNTVAKQFGDLVGKGLSWGVIGEFFFLSLPYIVAMTLPMAVLVAVLYAFSRLAAENEVTALRASGVSITRIVRPVMAGGAVLAAMMLLFNDQVLPRANHKLRTLQTDIARKKPTFALREQVINEVIPGKIFLKTGHIDQATNKLREVFIYNFEDPMHRKTIYADSGQMGLTSDQSTLQMTLHSGYVLEVPGDDPATLQRVYFTNDLVRVRGVANKFEKTEGDDYKSEREMTVCEMNDQYQRGVHQQESARRELAAVLGDAARYAATGVAQPTRPKLAVADRVTSGSLYCRFVSALFGGVSTAQAAEVPVAVSRDTGGTTRSAADTGAHRAASAGSTSRTGTRTPAAGKARRPQLLMRGTHVGSARPSGAARELRASVGHFHPPAISSGTSGTGAALTPAQPQGTSSARTAPLVIQQPAPRASSPAAPTPMATVGQIELARARLNSARSTIARYTVQIQKMFALAVTCVVFVLFGAPLALRFPRGGVGLVIGVSTVAFALYYICLIGGETLANELIVNPFWSMWAANAIFAAVGAVLMVRVQRSGATVRGSDARETWENVRGRVTRALQRVGLPVGRQRTA